MAKFRKKPVVIEAEQWEGHNLNSDVSLFQSPEVIIKDDGSEFIVSTLEGTMTGRKGDWLIRGVTGEFYPCAAAVFNQTYEPVPVFKNKPTIDELEAILKGRDFSKIALNPDGSITVN